MRYSEAARAPQREGISDGEFEYDKRVPSSGNGESFWGMESDQGNLDQARQGFALQSR